MPYQADNLLQSLAVARFGYTTRYSSAGTNVDSEVVFINAQDVIQYIPRAIIISFFAPFPSSWLGEGSSPPNTIMRRVAGVEMVVSYGCLLGLVFFGRSQKQQLAFWIVVLFCFLLILPQGLVVANVGTLYRFRYGSYMMFICLGMGGYFQMLCPKGIDYNFP
jgi:hypothetical protein